MKTSAIILAVLAFAAGAGGQTTAPATRPSSAPVGAKVRILCSTFPIYLFTRNVAQGRPNVQVELMISASVGCPHDYVLTPQDMRKLATADVFFANGLGMEEFLGQPLQKGNPRLRVFNTSAGIADLIELSEPPHEAETEQGAADSHAIRGQRRANYNPHLFASPRRAALIVRNIAGELARIDPAGSETFRKNGDAYVARLEKLADELARAVGQLSARKIVTEHAVFDYLARDAGLEIAAVVEEHPGQEPSAANMIALTMTIRASGTAAVFIEPQYPAKVAQTVAAEANVPVAVLDPVACGPSEPPMDYYETVMNRNIATLKATLGWKGN